MERFVELRQRGSSDFDTGFAVDLSNIQDGFILKYQASNGTFIGISPSAATLPLTTKGDLVTYSTLDIRLAVGANGTVLTADSTQPTGLSWAASSATPGGSNTYIQFNNSSAFGGISSFTWTSGTSVLKVLSGATFSAVGAAGDTTVRIGLSSVAGATNTISIGNTATDNSLANDSVILGYHASATGGYNIAIGSGAVATAINSTVIGHIATDNNNASCVAIGKNASTGGSIDVVIGAGAASGVGGGNSVVIGTNAGTQTGNSDNVVIGKAAVAHGSGCVIIGSTATGTSFGTQTLVGFNAVSNSGDGTAFGWSALANAVVATSIGSSTRVTAAGGTALGSGATATHASSCAIGYLSASIRAHAVVIGTTSEELLSAGGIGARANQAAKVEDYITLAGDFLITVDCSAADRSITLRSAASCAGQIFIIKLVAVSGSFKATVIGTVDGTTNPTISTLWETLVVISNGTQYYTISDYSGTILI